MRNRNCNDEPEPEPVVKKAFVPSQESNRRPFRPTEMISPIYGYNRPSVETKVVQEEEKGQEKILKYLLKEKLLLTHG